MDRKDAIKKAKRCKKNGGVGCKFVTLNNSNEDELEQGLKESNRLIRLLEKM